MPPQTTRLGYRESIALLWTFHKELKSRPSTSPEAAGVFREAKFFGATCKAGYMIVGSPFDRDSYRPGFHPGKPRYSCSNLGRPLGAQCDFALPSTWIQISCPLMTSVSITKPSMQSEIQTGFELCSRRSKRPSILMREISDSELPKNHCVPSSMFCIPR